MKIIIKDYELEGKKRYVGDVTIGRWTYSTNSDTLDGIFEWCRKKLENV